MIKQQILAISSDPAFCYPFQNEMGNDTTEIHCAASLSEALSCIAKTEYCLIIMDMQLSDMNKTEMVRILHVIRHLPIIAVSTVLESNEIVALYRAGIAAYMEKPFDFNVCAAQADALIRLYLQTEETSKKRATLAFGSSLVISPYHRQVLIEGMPIDLTRKEFDLLHYFAQHPHQVFSTGQLYEQIWENAFDVGGESTVMVHINTLRKNWVNWGQRSYRLCGVMAIGLSRRNENTKLGQRPLLREAVSALCPITVV